MNSKPRLNGLLAAALTGSLALAITSCGGGSGAPAPGPNPGDGPAAGRADLVGQLTQGSGSRPVSTVGSPLPGVITSLISTTTGAVTGSDITDSLGNFEIKNVPSGNGYLVKIEFTTSKDIDGDGSPDQVEMYFPVDLASQAVASLNQAISLDDSNSDGSDDSIDVVTQFSDDKGHHESHHHQTRHRDGRSAEDSNGNGNFGDDSSFDDSNHDLLPDDSNHDGTPDDSGNHDGFVSGEVSGAIEAISASSITVGGVEYAITSATEFKIGDRSHVSYTEFSVGDLVKVEGFASSDGSFVATEVKDSTAVSGGGDDSGDDSIDDGNGGGSEPGDDNGGDSTGDDNGGGDDSGSGGDDSGSGSDDSGSGGSDDSGSGN